MDGQVAEIRYPFVTPPEEGSAIDVAEGVLWMRLPLPMRLDHVNVYALDDGDGWTLIDTGFDTKRTRGIWQKLIDGPLRGRRINRLIGTHHHPDHIGLAGWFQVEHGAELAMTRTAWLLTRMLILDVQEEPLPETLAFYRSSGMAPDLYEKRATERPFNFADVVHPLPLGFTRISEGDTVSFGGRDWLVRLGDGHAPDHATFWSQSDNLVLGGDQLLPSISPNLGVHASEPEADPVGEWLAACHRLAPYAEADQLVLPGHKLPFTGLPTRMRQLIENHTGALKRLLDFLDQPRTAAECFMPIFKREIEGAVYGLALVEALAHLNHLFINGYLVRERRADGAWLWQRAT